MEAAAGAMLRNLFTEQGVARLSSVLRSKRAVQVNVAIMRTFVRLRELLATHEELWQKIEVMEKKYDTRFQAILATIKQMLETPIPPRRRIGFRGGAERLQAANRLDKPPQLKETKVFIFKGIDALAVEPAATICYTFVVVDSQKISTIDTSTRANGPRSRAPRQ
jgi:hypothetical protein